jgi:hypothetical protein
MGLLLTSLGAFLLFFSIWDQHSATQMISATIVHHQPGHPSTLTIQTQDPTWPKTPLSVPENAYQQLVDGTTIQLLYSQHLQVPLTIVAAGQRYPLSETSSLEEPANAFLPLLLGLLLLCYPAVLARWGWRDLFIERMAPEQIHRLNATVVGKRNLLTGQNSRPGRTHLSKGRAWYGLALRPATTQKEQKILTFSVKEENFSAVDEGDQIQIRYSPHLHYVYALKQLNSTR